jgi:fructose-bisphosphate aldolase, class II
MVLRYDPETARSKRPVRGGPGRGRAPGKDVLAQEAATVMEPHEQTTKLAPGVVTGPAYRALVASCKRGGHALAAINITNSSMLNAALEAAGRSQTDLVIQLSNGGAQFYAGAGLADPLRARVLGAVAAAQHVHVLAAEHGVCVALHTDHANRGLLPWIEGLIDASRDWHRRHGAPLFSSHMLDLSEEPLEHNLAECERTLRRLVPLDVSLEIELGVTGGEEDGVGADLDDRADNAHLYTQPEDVLLAYERLAPIGHFSVAASFGNVHGVYKPGNVRLRPEILRASQELVAARHGLGANPLDLVFHGGSGSQKAQIAEAIGYGVFKMNLDTDTQFAFAGGVGAFVRAHERAFQHQLDPDDGRPYKKLYDPRVWMRAGEERLRDRLLEAFHDLGSLGRSLAATS